TEHVAATRRVYGRKLRGHGGLLSADRGRGRAAASVRRDVEDHARVDRLELRVLHRGPVRPGAAQLLLFPEVRSRFGYGRQHLARPDVPHELRAACLLVLGLAEPALRRPAARLFGGHRRLPVLAFAAALLGRSGDRDLAHRAAAAIRVSLAGPRSPLASLSYARRSDSDTARVLR